MKTSQGLIHRIDLPNLLLGLLLCALLVAMNYSSSGVVRQGGDDEGSGIGGTGRMPIPGSESGLGGTGLRPFVGLNEHSEVEMMISPADLEASVTTQLQLDIAPVQAAPTTPAAPVVSIADQRFPTTDSSPVLITEQMQWEADINALYTERQIAVNTAALSAAATSAATALSPSGSAPDNATAASEQAPAARPVVDNEQQQAGLEIAAAASAPLPASSTDKSTTDNAASAAGSGDDQVSWDALASLLADSDDSEGTARMESVSFDNEEETARMARPERIQRPQLPPVQRVRPIQRAAILPPRVRPLRL